MLSYSHPVTKKGNRPGDTFHLFFWPLTLWEELNYSIDFILF